MNPRRRRTRASTTTRRRPDAANIVWPLFAPTRRPSRVRAGRRTRLSELSRACARDRATLTATLKALEHFRIIPARPLGRARIFPGFAGLPRSFERVRSKALRCHSGGPDRMICLMLSSHQPLRRLMVPTRGMDHPDQKSSLHRDLEGLHRHSLYYRTYRCRRPPPPLTVTPTAFDTGIGQHGDGFRLAKFEQAAGLRRRKPVRSRCPTPARGRAPAQLGGPRRDRGAHELLIGPQSRSIPEHLPQLIVQRRDPSNGSQSC